MNTDESGLTKDELRRKLARLQLVFRNSVDVLIVVDPSSGLIQRISDAVSVHLGFQRQDIIGKHFSCILPSDCIEGGKPEVLDGVFIDQEIRKSDGSLVEMDMTISLVSENGHSAILITLRDTTERKNVQHDMMKKRSALDASLSAMLIADRNWTIEYANTEALSYWEIDSEAMNELSMDDLMKCSALLDSLKSSVMETGKWDGELECFRIDGSSFHTRATATVVLNDDGSPSYVLSFIDISRRIRLESQLREMSLHDSLTGLYNRRGFMMIGTELLETAQRRKPEIGLLFVDMDNLKAINDGLGHAMGDRSILTTAGVLSTVFRNSDLIARIGGDEFVAFFLDITDCTGSTLKERLYDKIEELNSEENLPFILSLSFGFTSEKITQDTQLTDLLSRADKQMYLDKQERRRKVTENIVLRQSD